MAILSNSEAAMNDLTEFRGISVEVLWGAGLYHDGESFVIPYPALVKDWKVRYYWPAWNGREKSKYRDEKGQGVHLYNPMLLGPGEEEVWIAEGEMDTLSLIDQGLNAIGVHGVDNIKGDEDSGELTGRFRPEWALLFEDTKVVTMFDNDEKGRLAGRIAARGLKGKAFDCWDDRYSDINDWHNADPQALCDAIAKFREKQGWT